VSVHAFRTRFTPAVVARIKRVKQLAAPQTRGLLRVVDAQVPRLPHVTGVGIPRRGAHNVISQMHSLSFLQDIERGCS